MTSISFPDHRVSEPTRGSETHLALFYASTDEYLDGVMRFITPALEAGEPVAIAVPGPKGDLIRKQLNGHASQVEMLDMYELGRNPARIIPAVEGMLARHNGSFLHYVGEPIWSGRSREEICEATRHEALMNLAWPGARIRVLCPYDTTSLDPAVLEDAERTHPHLVQNGVVAPSPLYNGPLVPVACKDPLPEIPGEALTLGFALHNLYMVRTLVSDMAEDAGLSDERASDLVLAVNELATNTIRHAGGEGTLHAWRQFDRLVCQVDDEGYIEDPLAGRRMPLTEVAGGVGLWMVNQVCDLVEVRSDATGTTVRVHVLLD